jgi:eukaryotic-like serine/threonine-protein kinase
MFAGWVVPDRSAGDRQRRGQADTDVPGGRAGPLSSPSLVRGPSEPFLPPGKVIGRFIVHRMLGVGATGVVYAAHDPDLDRTVALKVLRGELSDRLDARARFLREAQALARLSHPNVIAVYDVGAADHCTFIAMEFIAGQTFADWMGSSRRSWPEIVAVLAKAGRGLAAAHAAGLIHRDFKPANLLVGADGRVVVTDFGLARAVVETEALAGAGPAEEPQRDSELARSITRTGAVQGTPAYMAPEQRAGRPGDARADQFSFCVTLHEAVFGGHPFLPAGDGSRAREWPAAETAPRQGDARGIPAWLQRAIQRGLRWTPEDRHSDMDVLLAALNRQPLLRRRPVQLGLALLGAAAAAAIASRLANVDDESFTQRCTGGRDQVAQVWNPAAADRVRASFTSTDRPHAQASADRVAKRLDAYTGEWAAMHRDTCLATLRGEQSVGLLDRRMACLDRRLDRARALLDLFVHRAGGDVVDDAVNLVGGLEPLAICADSAALLSRAALPADPQRRARAIELERRADRADVEREAGRPEEAAKLARAILQDVQALDHPPAAAQAGRVLGLSLQDLGRTAEAREAFSGAQVAAARAGDVRLSTVLMLDLFLMVGVHEQRRDEADLLAKLAQAAIELPEVRGDQAMRARLLKGLAIMAADRGELERALELHRQVLAIHRRASAPMSEALADTESDLGNVLSELGRVDEARQHHLEALTIRRHVFGDRHPTTAAARVNLGNSYSRAGDRAEARHHYLLALAVLEKMRSYRGYPVLLNNLGSIENDSGNFVQARAYNQAALDALTEQNGADHPDVATAAHNLGNVYYNEEDFAKALALHRRALDIRERKQRTHPRYAISLAAVGEDYRRLGRAAESLTYQRRALASLGTSLGDHPIVGYVLTCQGLALVDLGRRREAIAPLERALRIIPPGEPDRGRAAFALARALEPRRPRSARCKALAREAFDIFTATHAASERDQVAAYLARATR